MTTQEIADYLEENNYPVNPTMQLPTDRVRTGYNKTLDRTNEKNTNKS